MKKVIALIGNSLLVQGLASRLREYSSVFEVHTVDLTAPDSLQQVSAAQPDIIIFDEGDFKNATYPPLVDFLNSLPEVVLLELRLDNPNVHLIQSTCLKASSTDDLVQIFNNSHNMTALSIIS